MTLIFFDLLRVIVMSFVTCFCVTARPLRYNEKQHVVKVPGSNPELKTATALPANIEDYSFSKYISIHFKVGHWGQTKTFTYERSLMISDMAIY